MSKITWDKLPFTEAFKDVTSKAHKVDQGDFKTSGQYPIIDQGQDFIAGYLDDSSLTWKSDLPVIIFGDHTRAIKYVDFPFVLGADGTKVLKPHPSLYPKFAYYAILDINLPSAGYSRHFKFLKEWEIPYASLPEQKRIAAILCRADRLRHLRRYARELSSTYLQSVFWEMFGDPMKNPMGWPIVTFSEIGKLDRGRSKHRPRDAPELYGGSYPFIQTGDVANAEGYVRNYSQTYSDLGLKQSKLWTSGTMCITIAANIAKTAIVAFDTCFPDSIVGFTPNERTNVEFIQNWFSFAQRKLEDTAPESAQKNINLEILRKLEIALPPKPLQEQFARVVQRFGRLRSQQYESERQAEHLFQTLLHRAFKGELS